MWKFDFLQVEHFSAFYVEPQGHSGNIPVTMIPAGARVHEEEAGFGIPEHLRNMCMAANEKIRTKLWKKRLCLGIRGVDADRRPSNCPYASRCG